MKYYRKVLTIAGSDSGGGAGIQADLKTFSACGCYGMSAITAITAQNTCGVIDIHSVPLANLEAQIRAVLDDIGADAIKIGMLHSSPLISLVAKLLREYQCENIVIDPVMVATSGDRLIEEIAVHTLKKELLPLATLVTPNLFELGILLEKEITTREDLEKGAAALQALLSTSVLAKGGHLATDRFADVLISGQDTTTFEVQRIKTKNSHGTGCTLSSAIAAFLAQKHSLLDSVRKAEGYLQGALLAASTYEIGKGHGPVHHFHDFW